MFSHIDLIDIRLLLLTLASVTFALGYLAEFRNKNELRVWGPTNKKHLAKLKKGIEVWNQWRENESEIRPDLTSANLCDAHLSQGDFRGACLRAAKFSYAYLDHANLNDADLSYARLNPTYLDHANLNNADLTHADLQDADLFNANLSGAVLSDANLLGANLSGAVLSDANLRGSNLRGANFSFVDLSHANLAVTQVIGTNFDNAILTGACIADWQINSFTTFDGVQCDYIFRTYNGKFTDRLPVDPDSVFKPGEFEQWIKVRQGALDTIDITFTEGIDWQSFFRSLQTVRQQHLDTNVVMRAVEERNGVFVARLKLETELTGEVLERLKTSVENEVKASYERQLAEACGEIKALERSLDRSERSLDKVVEKLAMTSKYTIHGDVGNLADVNWGEMKATINQNYGAQADDIIQLLTSLRETAQSFPAEQKATAQIHIEDLTNDIAQPQPNPARLKTRFIALLGVAIAVGGAVATATDFVNNVLEISDKLDVPTQAFQPQLKQLKQIHPDFDWTFPE